MWGLGIGVVMFAAGLAWEHGESRRYRLVRDEERAFSDLERLRKWVAGGSAALAAFLLALAAYSA